MANAQDDINNKVPSLQTICVRAILKRHVNVAGVVDVMRYFEEVNWMIEQGPMLRQSCMAFMLRAYESIKRKVGEDAIREVVRDEVVNALNEQAKERAECVKKIKIVGRVVERTTAKAGFSGGSRLENSEKGLSTGGKLVRSVSGKSAFPYQSLTAGFKWPSEVDPRSREEHLSAGEFQEVFGVTFKEYQAFPSWKRLQLKKEKMLF